MIVVHHLENSRSQRVLWLLEELGLEYELVQYKRNPATLLAPPELRKIHPLGKSPVVTDDGTTLAESGAILEYLVRRYGGGRLIPPADTPEHVRFTYWMHYAEGSAMPPLLLRLVFNRVKSGPLPFFVKPIVKTIVRKVNEAFIEPQLKLHLDFMEGELDNREWFVGDAFTAADIQMSFPVEAAAARGGLGPDRPNLWGWLKRIKTRPAYQRALERGGPFTIV